jgi:hypothetical protein
LFADASKAFLEQVEQTVKLIRSKGVGVFFCTQLPTDIPNDILSQLGARIQHALRAFTPDDQKALSKTVRTYPKTDVYDLESALTSLGIGEAVVTVLSEKGAPTPVAWTRMRVPRSLMASIGNDAIKSAAKSSALQATYGETKSQPAQPQAGPSARPPSRAPQTQSDYPPVPSNEPVPPMPEPAEPAGPKGPSMWEEVLQNPTVKSGINTAIREVVKNIFGSGTGRRRRK